MSQSVNITSFDCRFTAEQLKMFRNSKSFQDWLIPYEDSSQYLLEEVVLTDLDIFGNRVGFSKFEAKIFDRINKIYLPGIVLLRGDSVAILVIIRCSDNLDVSPKVLLTKQFRTSQSTVVYETIAGMMDSSQKIKGKALDELKGESGIELESKQLINLTEWAGINQGMMMSPGLQDERIHILFTELNMTESEIDNLEDSQHGVLDEGEVIRLMTVNIDDAYQIGDAKLLSALLLYREYKTIPVRSSNFKKWFIGFLEFIQVILLTGIVSIMGYLIFSISLSIFMNTL